MFCVGLPSFKDECWFVCGLEIAESLNFNHPWYHTLLVLLAVDPVSSSKRNKCTGRNLGVMLLDQSYRASRCFEFREGARTRSIVDL